MGADDLRALRGALGGAESGCPRSAGASATSTWAARSTSAFLPAGGCGRWGVLIEKKYITWAELTDRLAEVQQRYAGGLGGRYPEAQPKSEGDPSHVGHNYIVEAMGRGDPQRFAGQAGPAKFKPGERVRVRGVTGDVLHPYP